MHWLQGAGEAPAAATALGEQDAGGELVNADAERALLRVKHKLEGVDSGVQPPAPASMAGTWAGPVYI